MTIPLPTTISLSATHIGMVLIAISMCGVAWTIRKSLLRHSGMIFAILCLASIAVFLIPPIISLRAEHAAAYKAELKRQLPGKWFVVYENLSSLELQESKLVTLNAACSNADMPKLSPKGIEIILQLFRQCNCMATDQQLEMIISSLNKFLDPLAQ